MGELTIELDDVLIAAIDENFVQTGMFWDDLLIYFPETQLAGDHTLVFTLDSIGSQSIVEISDIRFVMSTAVPEPNSLYLICFIGLYLASKRRKFP